MRKKITIPELILFTVEKAVDGYVRLEDFAYNSHIYARGYERPLKKTSLAQALRRLRTEGYLSLENYNNKIILRLTKEGRIEASLKKILRDKAWDGKWRVVIFDIPEKHRRIRNVLRSKLKNWEFEPWQKSVWASKRNITVPLRQFIKQLGIEKWVRVLESVNV